MNHTPGGISLDAQDFMAQLEQIEAIEKQLWNAADTLRAYPTVPSPYYHGAQ